MHARSKAGAGFTIVETMIFLAISGLMFVLAISAMSGKQSETEFQVSIGDLKSKLNNNVAFVANGAFLAFTTGIGYATCSAPLGGPPAITLSPTAPTGGPDGTCTAIGQIIEFGTNPANGNQATFIVPVIGCNYQNCNGANEPATGLTGAMPIIDPAVYTSPSLPFNLTLDSTYPGTPGAIGIFSFTSLNGDGNSSNLGSGSGHVEIFKLPNFSYNPTNTPSNLTINSAGLIDCDPAVHPGSVCTNSDNFPEPINPTTGIKFCVVSGSSDNKSALFSLGGSSSVYSVTDKIFNGNAC